MSGIPAGAGQLLGKRLGKFEILALLALGGTAEIYLARIGGAAGFEKYVVVKCLHDHLADDMEFVKMFLDEARLAAHLDHSNIVQTMELGEHDGRYYMVMEFLAGLSMAMIVRRAGERLPTGRIPVPLVLNMLAQSCAGLHYAHEKAMNGKALNIVHRDISPQNLVISFEGVVKLVDFGIAKAELRETRTRSGTIKGKFAYMSPEQCVANNVDRRTDVFALGVIAHELLTGRRLFKRPSPYETYQAVMECDVRPPSTVDAELDPVLDELIMRAVTKDKADRYPTAEAFGDALLGYLHRRSFGSGPGEVSRFFDAYFGQEIDEHSGRMRELIAGRDISVEAGVSWGSDEDERREREEAAARDSRPSGDIALPQSASSLSLVLDDLGGGSRGELDDEMPAERTRIESNPLERVNELERLSASSGPGAGAGNRPASAPLPGAPGGPAMPASGRFPDLANLPTMIAGAEPVGPPGPPGAAGPAGPPGTMTSPPSPGAMPSALPAHARTQIAPMPPAAGIPASGAPAGLPGYGASAGARPGRPGGPLPGMPPPRAASPRPQSGSAPPPLGPGHPHDYPVMNAQLSEQIATGATVFPSEPLRGGEAPPGPPTPSPPARGSEPGRSHEAYLSPPAGGPAPPLPPRAPDLGGFDAQRAAGVLSPVGQQYTENVDWGSAAAGRARAVPPWLLAALFIGAIGVALALTVVIARLIT